MSFQRRLKACELYCGGDLSAREVGRRVGLSAVEVTRLVHSALRTHPDGEIYGQRALVPYIHGDGYERSDLAEGGTAGLFTQLLERFPDVRAEIVAAYKQGKRLTDIHHRMLRSLAVRGVTVGEYPFNTQRRAFVALSEFCKGLADRYFQTIAEMRHGHPAGQRAKSSQLDTYVRDILRPYSRVEVDAHRVDAVFVLKLTRPDGTVRTVTLRRLLIVVLLDVGSRAVLGHALSLNHTESRLDVLRAIERALSDAPPMPITEPGLTCRADSGLPVHILPHCAFRAVDEFAFDNSRTALSRPLQQTLIQNLQARVNLGESDHPEGRAFVESFFKKLTERGTQQLPSTTGGSPESPKRRYPEEKAHRYQLTLEAAEQILEVIVREYNNTPHGTLDCTPLDYIRAWDASGALIRRLPKDARGLDFLYEQKLILTVRGGVASGTRPYVQYKQVRYRNSQLAHHGKLVGAKIVGILDRRNIALIRAFLPSGEPLGVLKAQGRWGLSPHSLKTRQAILRLERRGELPELSVDPLGSYVGKLTELGAHPQGGRERAGSSATGTGGGYRGQARAAVIGPSEGRAGGRCGQRRAIGVSSGARNRRRRGFDGSSRSAHGTDIQPAGDPLRALTGVGGHHSPQRAQLSLMPGRHTASRATKSGAGPAAERPPEAASDASAEHPLLSQKYRIPTPDVQRLQPTLRLWHRAGLTGGVLLGTTRIGKTTAVDDCIEHIEEIFQRRCFAVRINWKSSIRVSDRTFAARMLEGLGYGFTAGRPADRLEKALIERMVTLAYESGGRCALFIDDAQWLTPFEYKQLCHLFNALSDQNIALMVLLVGQPELRGDRALLRDGGDTQVIGRFMRSEFTFEGIRDVADLERLLAWLDDRSEYPPGSGQSYLRHPFSQVPGSAW